MDVPLAPNNGFGNITPHKNKSKASSFAQSPYQNDKENTHCGSLKVHTPSSTKLQHETSECAHRSTTIKGKSPLKEATLSADLLQQLNATNVTTVLQALEAVESISIAYFDAAAGKDEGDAEHVLAVQSASETSRAVLEVVKNHNHDPTVLTVCFRLLCRSVDLIIDSDRSNEVCRTIDTGIEKVAIAIEEFENHPDLLKWGFEFLVLVSKNANRVYKERVQKCLRRSAVIDIMVKHHAHEGLQKLVFDVFILSPRTPPRTWETGAEKSPGNMF